MGRNMIAQGRRPWGNLDHFIELALYGRNRLLIDWLEDEYAALSELRKTAWCLLTQGNRPGLYYSAPLGHRDGSSIAKVQSKAILAAGRFQIRWKPFKHSSMERMTTCLNLTQTGRACWQRLL